MSAYSSFRAYRLSFTHDESISYSILLGNLQWKNSANHHPLNTLLMGWAKRELGSSEWQLRLPNVVSHLLYLVFGLLLLGTLEDTAAVIFEPTLNYYRTARHYDWLSPATRDGISWDQDDVIYSFSQDIVDHPEAYTTIQTYPETGTVLVKVRKGDEIVENQRLTEVRQGTLKSGYVIVTSDKPNDSPLATIALRMVLHASVGSQATIAGVQPIYTTAVIPIDQVRKMGESYGLALMNASSQKNQITVTLFDEAGIPKASPAIITIGPFQQVVHYLSELFPTSNLGSLKGSVRIQGSRPFAPLVLSFAGSTFSPVETRMVQGTDTWETPIDALRSPGHLRRATTVFPQFALGGGWQTQIVLVNTSGRTMTGRIAWYDPNGHLTKVTMNGETQSVFSYSIPAAGKFVLAP